MIKYLCTCSLIFFKVVCFSQDATYYQDLENSVNDSTGTLRLNRILQQEFSRVINTNSNGVIGNYVGISTKDKTLSLGYSIVNKQSVVQLSASGGEVNGTTNILNDSKLNSNVTLGAQWNRMFGQQEINIVFDNIKKLQKTHQELNNAEANYADLKKSQQKKLDATLAKKTLAIQQSDSIIKKLESVRNSLLQGGTNVFVDVALQQSLALDKDIITSEIQLYENRILNSDEYLVNTLSELRAARRAGGSTYSKEEFKIDSLKLERLLLSYADTVRLKKVQLQLVEKKMKQNTYSDALLEAAKYTNKLAKKDSVTFMISYDYVKNGWEEGDVLNKIVRDRRKNLEKLNDIRAREISLRWIGIGFSIANESYDMFDPTKALNDQLFSELDVIPTATLSFTNYSNKRIEKSIADKRISFFTIAGSISSGNNAKNLRKVNLETVDSLSINRNAIKTNPVYIGAFEDKLITGKISVDYYRFKNAESEVGFHLRGETNFLSNQIITSIRAGFLFVAIKEGNGKSIVNFELFYGLNDILKTSGEDTIFNRNIMGIQTTFPFNFK